MKNGVITKGQGMKKTQNFEKKTKKNPVYFKNRFLSGFFSKLDFFQNLIAHYLQMTFSNHTLHVYTILKHSKKIAMI